MNPYATTEQTQKKQQNKIFSQIKKILALIVIVIFFTGCFKIQTPAPIGEVTTFRDMTKISLFHGVFVFPVAKILIWTHKIVKSTFITIFIVTLLNRAVGSLFTIKSTIEAEKMKEIQPYINNINSKYLGKKDRPSMIAKQMEMQKLFQKHNVNPMGSIGSMFLSFPLFMSIYVAIKNNVYLAQTTLFGVSTSLTASQVFKEKFNPVIAFFMLSLVVLQWLSIKLPQILARKNQKPHQKAMQGSQAASIQKNMEIMLPLLMLFISWQVSIALLVYFTVSPLFTMTQSYLIHQYFSNKKAKERNSINQLY